MKKLDPKLDAELSAFICGWHILDEKLGSTQHIIDMNLSDKVEPKEYTYRLDVLKDIETFLSYSEVQSHELVRRKMVAHQYFLLKTMGEQISYPDMMKHTMGVEPLMFSQKKITAMRAETDAILEPLGLQMRLGVSDDLDKREAVAKTDVVKIFEKSHVDFYENMKHKLNFISEFNSVYKEIDENVSKVAEIRGDGKNFDMLFNLYHMKDYGRSSLKLLAKHEITGHAVMFSQLRQQFEAGDMPRYMTYVTTHEPLQFGSEGLAETLEYFYPEEFQASPEANAHMAMDRLRRAAANNAGIMLNTGASVTESAEYVFEHAPNFPVGRVANMLGHYTTHPISMTYYSIYGQALETFREISQSCDDKDAFINSVYCDYLMPDQIKKYNKRPVAEFV